MFVHSSYRDLHRLTLLDMLPRREATSKVCDWVDRSLIFLSDHGIASMRLGLETIEVPTIPIDSFSARRETSFTYISSIPIEYTIYIHKEGSKEYRSTPRRICMHPRLEYNQYRLCCGIEAAREQSSSRAHCNCTNSATKPQLQFPKAT
jgi:hypothetical protein